MIKVSFKENYFFNSTIMASFLPVIVSKKNKQTEKNISFIAVYHKFTYRSKGFVYSADADADSRRDTCVFGRRVYSADGKFTIYIVDLVIFACLDFREFVICGLFTFTKYKIRKFSIFMISITRIIIIFAKSAKNKTSRILPGH